MSGVLGVLFTALGAGMSVAVVHIGGGTAAAVLVRALWIGVSVLATVSVLQLAVATVLWGVYLLRRAELDAAGGEALGEVRAHLASARPGDQ